MSAVVEPEISFQAELYGEATHEVRDRPTDGPSICTFVKPAGPRASEGRREETSRPFGPSRMAVVTTGPAAAVDGRGRPGGGRSGRFSSSSMRALLLVQSHSSPSLPPPLFREGQTPRRFRCCQRLETTGFKFLRWLVLGNERVSIIVKTCDP